MLFGIALSSCGGPSSEVTGAARHTVETWVTRDYGYRTPLVFDSVWRAQGQAGATMTCGQFEAPPEFNGDPRLIRFIYDFQTGVHQVEMHRLWTADSRAIMDRNRTLFDEIWQDQCAAFRP